MTCLWMKAKMKCDIYLIEGDFNVPLNDLNGCDSKVTESKANVMLKHGGISIPEDIH